jgi:chromate reductase
MSRIVILAGSNGKNLEVAKEFEKYLHKKETESVVVDIASLGLPLYTPLEEVRGGPESISDYRELFHSAAGFVFVTPEYNGGVPPSVTNLISWISRSGGDDWRQVFNGKPAALASFSGSGGIQALVSLRTQLSYIGLNTIGRQVRATYKEELKLSDVEAVSELLLKSASLSK